MNLWLVFMLMSVPDFRGQPTVRMCVMTVVMSVWVGVGESGVLMFVRMAARQHEDKGGEHDAPGTQLFSQDRLLQQ